MISLFNLVLSGGIGVFIVHYGLRAFAVLRLFRLVFWGEHYRSSTVADGEPIAAEGTVVVEEPVSTASEMVEPSETAVGAYLWRATAPGRHNTVDVAEREVNETRIGLASGFEHGEFGITGADGRFDIDPSWLLDRYDSPRLTDLDLSGVYSHINIRLSSWESPFLHLTTETRTREVGEIPALTGVDSAGTDTAGADGVGKSDGHRIAAKPILAGRTIAVWGILRRRQGADVIRGTDSHPLIIADSGVEALRADARSALARNSALLATFTTILVLSWHFL